MTLIAPLPFMFRESCANLTASIKDKRLSLPELLYLSATLFNMHTPNHAHTPSHAYIHSGIDTPTHTQNRHTPTQTYNLWTLSLIPIKSLDLLWIHLYAIQMLSEIISDFFLQDYCHFFDCKPNSIKSRVKKNSEKNGYQLYEFIPRRVWKEVKVVYW